VHWGEGLDFTSMRVELSDLWEETDYNVVFNMNFTDVREAINVTTNYGSGVQVMNQTFDNKPISEWTQGDNVLYNATEIREFWMVLNYKDPELGRELLLEGLQCISGTCVLDGSVEEVPMEEGSRLWSDPTSWPAGVVPGEEEEVEVESGWNMYYDLETSPTYKSITVNGRLSFYDATDVSLRTRRLFVRAGELFIGNTTHPFTNNAVITLVGDQDDETIALTASLEVYNKVLVSVGPIEMVGVARSGFTRLVRAAYKDDTEVYVAEGLDWVPGDKIFFGATAHHPYAEDYSEVLEYESSSGKLTLVDPLEHYHFGGPDNSEYYKGLDMRGEVALLTRNIVIEGEDADGWGG
jgi:hypothetical protein